MKRLFWLLSFCLILVACGGHNPENDTCTDDLVNDTVQPSLEEVVSGDAKKETTVDTVELKKSMAKIEKKYGEQWDFCDCVLKGDSINKAFQNPNLSEKEFDRLSKRFDEIDQKCQAFRIQDANVTPEEREIHERKVKKCLKAHGIKYVPH